MDPRSPISSPDFPDGKPVPAVAVARAADALVWALVQSLVEKNIISANELAEKLIPTLEGLRPIGNARLKDQEDNDRFATLLALERVMKALGKEP